MNGNSKVSWLNIKKTSELIYVIFMTIYTVLALILRFPGITPEFCGDIDKTRFLQIVKYLSAQICHCLEQASWTVG